MASDSYWKIDISKIENLKISRYEWSKLTFEVRIFDERVSMPKTVDQIPEREFVCIAHSKPEKLNLQEKNKYGICYRKKTYRLFEVHIMLSTVH